MNGALLVNKHDGVSSFGIIELLQRQLMKEGGAKRRDLPKLGHGGTLDPFATGLLVVLVGKAVKLARYFLGSDKTYEGVIRFGETTIPGDPTAPISETSLVIPESLEALQKLADSFTLKPYLQTPPMHSAKKRNGKPLYELARAGIEVDREPKSCRLYEFNIVEYQAPRAKIQLKCSSGTYVRTLAQDFGKLQNSVALLENLHRSASGIFSIQDAWSIEQIENATQSNQAWSDLPCWIPFDRLLEGHDRANTTIDEKTALLQGNQRALPSILNRIQSSIVPGDLHLTHTDSESQSSFVGIYCENELIAVARRDDGNWGIERVFV